jgi:iron(III)-enterobactin esterase
MKTRLTAVLFSILLLAGVAAAMAAPAARPRRPAPPTRDPLTEGYVTAKELPDGTVPPADADGNFIIGPTHPRAPEMSAQEGVPQGTIFDLKMESTDSKIYPGIAREPGTFGTPDPNDPAKLIVTTSHPAPYTRRVAVYVPGSLAVRSVGQPHRPAQSTGDGGHLHWQRQRRCPGEPAWVGI